MRAKLIVSGAAGRMGRRILSLGIDAGRLDIIAGIEKKGHADIGKDVGVLAGGESIGVAISDLYPAGGDVVIDFSGPEAVDDTINYCVASGAGLVLGTTGLSAAQAGRIDDACVKIAVVYGTNMSVGMNVLFAMVAKAAAMLGADYDVEIVEQHHRFKKDAPSGSALTLAENICAATGRDFPGCLVHGREGKDALREKGTIGLHAVRAGDITGIHSVILSTLGETVTLGHAAHNRDGFAKGALRAAEWLIGKKAGMYTMADCLGLG